jgi:hypothetical protein
MLSANTLSIKLIHAALNSPFPIPSSSGANSGSLAFHGLAGANIFAVILMVAIFTCRCFAWNG